MESDQLGRRVWSLFTPYRTSLVVIADRTRIQAEARPLADVDRSVTESCAHIEADAPEGMQHEHEQHRTDEQRESQAHRRRMMHELTR